MIEKYLNKIIQGNCTDLLRQLPEKSVDLCLTDLPYGIDYDYDVYKDTKENLQKLIKETMPEILRVSKRVAIFSGINNIWQYPEADWVINYTWNTTGTYGALGYNQWQPILYYGKDIAGFGSVNGELKSDSIKFNGGAKVGFLREEEIDHPCPKPINIMEKLVKRFSNEREIILDPFSGSGSTAVATIRHKRNFIGFELSEKYCAIANKRIQNELNKLAENCYVEDLALFKQ